MVMDYETYVRARKNAEFHLQVELLNTSFESSYRVPLRAKVRTIFRGSEKISVDDEVHFSIAVYGAGQEYETPMPDAWGWTSIEKLRAARFAELFLDGTPPDCNVADYSFCIIVAPSTLPQRELE